jgi:hypothetical protein
MSGTDPLLGFGSKLTAALIGAAAPKLPDAHLVFLPGGVSVPGDIIQSGLVNLMQLQTWLAMNFDYPFIVAADQAAVHGREDAHGTATQIYTLATTGAQPLGDPASDAWKRVAGQITAARASLGPAEAIKMIACEPDDWPVPAAKQYWTIFDFSETDTVTTTTPTPINPGLWKVRSLDEHLLDERPVIIHPPIPISPGRTGTPIRPMLAMAEPHVSAVVTASTAAPATVASAAPLHLQAWRSASMVGALPPQLDTSMLFNVAPTVQNVTTSTSAGFKVHLEHQCVTLGRIAAGQPWWDSTFLADTGWYVPGLPRGGLLPPLDTSAAAVTYAIPVGMVIVQNLSISGQFTQEANSVLSSAGGTLGPLSLFGAVISTATDGVTITFAHQGMQVIALLCSPLPIVPPADSPAHAS